MLECEDNNTLHDCANTQGGYDNATRLAMGSQTLDKARQKNSMRGGISTQGYTGKHTEKE